MKCLLIFLLCLPGVAAAQYIRVLDTATVYKDLRIGANTKQLGLKMKFEDTDKGVNLYYVTSPDYFTNNGIKFKTVMVSTVADTIVRVKLIADGANGRRFLAELITKFGYPDKDETTKDGPSYSWLGERVALNCFGGFDDYHIVFILPRLLL